MAIIVEDGTIVASANSYMTIAEADTYFTLERPGVSDWEDLDEEVKEASLRYSVKLLDTECWLGYRTEPNAQELAHPRTNLWDADRRRYFRPDEIPDFLKCASAELAVALSREDRTLTAESAGGAGLERVKIDVLEIEWAENAAKIAEDAKPLIPDIVMRFIGPYIYGNNGMQVKVYRV